MHVTLFMAQSVNGMIAQKNRKEDFLSDANWFCFKTLAEQAGCFVVGRIAYQEVERWEEYTFKDINARCIVLSRNKEFKPKKGFLVARSPRAALRKAATLSKRVLVAGGGQVNAAFLKQKLVDECVVTIEPCLLGQGINACADSKFLQRLSMKRIIRVNRNIVQLTYTVKKITHPDS